MTCLEPLLPLGSHPIMMTPLRYPSSLRHNFVHEAKAIFNPLNLVYLFPHFCLLTADA